MTIFFDEAGNSGQNLLDRNQPVYVLVSHNFSEQETKEILSPMKTSAEELHFVKVRKYPKYHQPLTEILDNKEINSDRVKIALAHKKYVLGAQLCNYLVETSYYYSGVDFNINWENVKYANVLYLSTLFSEQKDNFNELLVLFQEMIRLKDQEAVDKFYDFVVIMYNKMNSEKEKVFFFPILKSKDYINRILESINKFSIDLSLPTLIVLSDVWSKASSEQINIVHDDSKQVEFWKEYITYMSSIESIKKQEIGYDTRKMTFPLQISSIKLVNSKDNLQVQLADLLGSAFAHYTKNILLENNRNDKVANIIANSRLANIYVYPLWPDSQVFEEKEYDDLSDIDPLDFLANIAKEDEVKFKKSFPK